ncbi:hypothetical protein [Mycoplasmopsis felifaucium]|uniref:hypothetical protein n=1 Tax=Mycoplasmopsis felifaucium TaxID=35768 RepID=UPI000481C1AA|nr:hypothetical protein [Mycoplasmopsis felifaucium]
MQLKDNQIKANRVKKYICVLSFELINIILFICFSIWFAVSAFKAQINWRHISTIMLFTSIAIYIFVVLPIRITFLMKIRNQCQILEFKQQTFVGKYLVSLAIYNATKYLKFLKTIDSKGLTEETYLKILKEDEERKLQAEVEKRKLEEQQVKKEEK